MRRRIVHSAAVVVGGAALAHAFSSAYIPLAWDGLAWIALVPVFAVALESRPRAAFGWSWLGGFVFFLGLLRWLNFTFRTYSAIPWPLTWGPTMLLAGYCALWIGVVGALVAWLARRTSPSWALLAAPFLWVSAEWGRGHLMGGFPWGLLGYSQHARLPVIQIAELTGVYGVSFVVIAVNAVIAGCVLLPLRRALEGLALAGVLVGATLGFGAWRLGETAPAPEITVAAMQPAIEQPLKWDERYTATTLHVYFSLTRSVGSGGADLIVWPETASPTVLRQDPGLLAALRGVATALDTRLVIGSIDTVDGARYRNTAFLVTGQGIESRYDKIHLVPFGEYVPLANVIGFVRNWAEFISDMEPGSRAVVFPGPPAPFGVVICYEGIFPELFREFVRNGARFMVNMTNDAWFGRTTGPGQHLAMYPFRAVEHRVALVRAANTGISAVISPTGAVTRRMGLFERGMLAGKIPLRRVLTLYTRLGDWFVYFSLVISGVAVAAAFARSRRFALDGGRHGR